MFAYFTSTGLLCNDSRGLKVEKQTYIQKLYLFLSRLRLIIIDCVNQWFIK